MPLHICGGRPAGPSCKWLPRLTSSGFWEGLFPGMFCSGASLVWQLLLPRRAGELLPIQCPTQPSSWEQLRNPARGHWNMGRGDGGRPDSVEAEGCSAQQGQQLLPWHSRLTPWETVPPQTVYVLGCCHRSILEPWSKCLLCEPGLLKAPGHVLGFWCPPGLG